MAGYLARRWERSYEPGASRRDRTACDYQAYLPDPLVGRSFSIDGDVAADLSDAETDVARLNERAVALIHPDALARLLLRAEAVASSHIEGLQLGARRLLRAEMARPAPSGQSNLVAEEIIGNIRAMDRGIHEAAAAPEITVAHLLEMHRDLLGAGPLGQRAGQMRTEQNWIGGTTFNPCRAAFVPPPPEEVPALFDDLIGFCNQDGLSPLAQAAIAHAQFETIHPFVDGNGRIGRALVHVVLRRRGLAPRLLPPISLALAARPSDYVLGLSDTRYVGEPTSAAARQGWNTWLGLFAAATRRAVHDAEVYEEQVGALQDQWRARLGSVRANSALARLLAALPRAPVFTVATARELIARSFEQTNEAVARLEAAGIVRPVSVGRRNRAFEATDIIDIFTDLERRLASPESDTRIAPPARPAPQRRAATPDPLLESTP